ncbi:T9SS type A sorting domain-containing protein [bacterium]|nr:T9SS type A sorting domain-containing protein [bacterium]
MKHFALPATLLLTALLIFTLSTYSIAQPERWSEPELLLDQPISDFAVSTGQDSIGYRIAWVADNDDNLDAIFTSHIGGEGMLGEIIEIGEISGRVTEDFQVFPDAIHCDFHYSLFHEGEWTPLDSVSQNLEPEIIPFRTGMLNLNDEYWLYCISELDFFQDEEWILDDLYLKRIEDDNWVQFQLDEWVFYFGFYGAFSFPYRDEDRACILLMGMDTGGGIVQPLVFSPEYLTLQPSDIDVEGHQNLRNFHLVNDTILSCYGHELNVNWGMDILEWNREDEVLHGETVAQPFHQGQIISNQRAIITPDNEELSDLYVWQETSYDYPPPYGDFYAIVAQHGRNAVPYDFILDQEFRTFELIRDGNTAVLLTLDTNSNLELRSLDLTDLNAVPAPIISPAGFEIVSIYPNPFNDFATILISSSNNELLGMSVFNLLGQEVYSKMIQVQNGNNNILLNNSFTGNGGYWLHFKGSNKTISKHVFYIK